MSQTPTSDAETANGLVLASADVLVELVRTAESSIHIAAPFILRPAAELLVRAATYSSAASRVLLTTLSERSVRSSVLDVEALRAFEYAGFELRSVENLHAKVLVVDDSDGIVGSGNLTASGMGLGPSSNAELGVRLSSSQAADAADVLRRWLDESDAITAEDLEAYGALEPYARQSEPGIGALGKRIAVPSIVGDVLVDSGDVSSHEHWLKSLHPDRTGSEVDGWWRSMSWINDRHVIREVDGEPIQRPSYTVGDLIALYISGEVGVCPAAYEVTAPAVFDPERVAAEATIEDAAKYGWVTEVRAIASTTFESAPRLADIGVAPASMRQRGRLRLTPTQYEAALRGITGEPALGGVPTADDAIEGGDDPVLWRGWRASTIEHVLSQTPDSQRRVVGELAAQSPTNRKRIGAALGVSGGSVSSTLGRWTETIRVLGTFGDRTEDVTWPWGYSKTRPDRDMYDLIPEVRDAILRAVGREGDI